MYCSFFKQTFAIDTFGTLHRKRFSHFLVWLASVKHTKKVDRDNRKMRKKNALSQKKDFRRGKKYHFFHSEI